MKYYILICLFFSVLVGCSNEPLSRVECKELLIKSTEIYTNYNTKFKSELIRVKGLTDDQFEAEMGDQVDKCKIHWNKTHYKCVFESKTLDDLSQCNLETK